jgi:hypothetical protein
MQTRTAAILIFVGALLLYLGVFGLVIPFRFAVTGSPEDFSTYTEVDPNSHISKTATHIDHVGYSNEDCYLYKDKGANHFADFVHLMDVKFVSSGSAQYGHSLYSLSNDVDDWKGLVDTGKTAIGIIGEHASEYPYLLFVVEAYGGVQYSSGPSPVPIPEKEKLAENTWYYLNLVKSGTSLTLTIYSDAARINLVNTKSILLHANHQFRYVFGVNSLNEPLNAWCEVYWDNLYLQEGTTPPPSTGTIQVNAQYYSGAWIPVPQTVTVTVTCDGSQKQVPATFSGLAVGSHIINLVTTSITVSSGVTYSFSQWEDSSTATTRQVSVASGEAKTLCAYYSQGTTPPPPPPPPTDDWFELIKQYFQNAVLKSIFVLAGVLLTGIGVIGLLPHRKTSQRPTPYPYY